MQITPDTRVVVHDLSVMQAVLPQKILLGPNGHRVRTGTPLVIEQGGWRPTKPGESPMMFAMTPGEGGDYVDACRAMIVELHAPTLVVGRVRIVDVDHTGRITFVNDDQGPYIALTRSRVMLG